MKTREVASLRADGFKWYMFSLPQGNVFALAHPEHLPNKETTFDIWFPVEFLNAGADKTTGAMRLQAVPVAGMMFLGAEAEPWEQRCFKVVDTAISLYAEVEAMKFVERLDNLAEALYKDPRTAIQPATEADLKRADSVAGAQSRIRLID